MKPHLLNIIFLLSVVFLLTKSVKTDAQQNLKDAGSYLMYIEKENEAINKDLWGYTSTVAHNKSAKKVEMRRKELINSISSGKSRIARMPDFEGDISLRDSLVSFLNLCYNVLNQDYAKIVDMEEIAEQSYDLMEAYMMAQEKANDKVDAANNMIDAIYKKFALTHNIRLVEKQDGISKKLSNASQVFKHYNFLYLMFFKSYKQEAYVMDAIERNDLNAAEQNRSKLKQITAEDIRKLDTVKGFKGDLTLRKACFQLLKFYNTESDKVTALTDFQIKKDNFDKIKAAVDAKGQASHTQSDVENYNKAADEYKKAVDDYNRINKELYAGRKAAIENWNTVVQAFFQKYIPRN